MVMSGDSRLSYHAIPKILRPPSSLSLAAAGSGAVLPECLSELTLEGLVRSGGCVCSREIAMDDSPVARHRGNSETCNQELGQEFESRTQSTDQEPVTATRNSLELTCRNCENFLETWKYFEKYLLCSRININVREMGSW